MACVVHLIIILAVNFDFEDLPDISKGLEITLSTQPSTCLLYDAEHIAQSDQIGSGTLEHEARQTTDQPPLVQDNELNEVSPESTIEQTQAQNSDDNVISTLHERPDVVQQQELQEEVETTRPVPILDREQLAMDIASLEAEYDLMRQESTKRPRVSRQNTVAAKRDITAWYRDTWRKKVERIGNLNYPEEARRKGIYGSLRLLVEIRSDVSLINVSVLESSGQPVLDEAAQRIVRLSAPFAPFTGEMAAKFDQLEIIRTWRFGRDDFLSSH